MNKKQTELPEFPDMQTVSTRLTWQDYTLFKQVVRTMGHTMHGVIRMLISAWLQQTAFEVGANAPVSRTLRAAVRLDKTKKRGYILPREWDICRRYGDTENQE